MDEDGALFDSGFDDGGPFRVTPEAGGVSLESALRDFGPAAIDDLIPRLRALAVVLDAAHASGAVHGAVDPSKVIVYDQTTSLIAGKRAHHPYLSPEAVEGGPTAAADQYALAAVAYEWLFGRPIDHAADRPVEVRSMPGVDRAALSKVFTRALAPNPRDRFASCVQFVDAIAASTDAATPMLALEPEDEHDPVEPFTPEALDLEIAQEEPHEGLQRGASFDSSLAREIAHETLAQDQPPVAVPGWNSSPSYQRAAEPQRFGAVALILATIVGAIFGFAGGYMARPRALQSGPVETFANTSPVNEAPAPSPVAAPAVAETHPAPPAPKPVETPKPQVGRLLVRSTPSGAVVSVDGVSKGVTPLALRDLEMGTRSITVARRGYLPETRKVVITTSRPARSLDVRLSAEAQAVAPKPAGGGAPRPATPASLGKPALTVGSLTIDSRPIGAAVTVNGKPSGSTPVTMNDLAPGEYRILMTMAGYRNFATTVRVVAGEHARAAASLTALEQR